MTPNETWKDIKGYEGHYMVSDLGRVKSVSRMVNGRLFESKLLRLERTKRNRIKVQLRGGKDRKMAWVHRLVAECFVPKVTGKNCINHINGISDDNRAVNLEWCTYKENSQHAWRTGLIKYETSGLKPRTKKIKENE